MGKLNKNQLGFGTVETLLIIVIVAMLGAVGWYVYDKSQDKTAPSSTTTSPVETTKQNSERVDETANWSKVTSGEKAFTVKVPDGWNLLNWTSRDYLYAGSYKDLTYTSGEKATVASGDTYAIDSGPVRHFNITGNPISQKDSVGYYFGETAKDFGAVSGVEGKKYAHTYAEDVDRIKKGDKVYLYRFEGVKTLITVDYYVLNGETDQSNLIEKAIKTLVFE